MNAEVSRMVLQVLLAAGLAGAVIVDLRSRRIPNAVTVPTTVLGIVFNTLSGGWTGLASSLGGTLLGLLVLMPVWLHGGTGAGDVKLLAMVGALRGPEYVLWTALFGAVAGGVLALVLLAWKGGSRQVVSNAISSLYRMASTGSLGAVEPTARSFRMSYAVAIALGAAIAHWHLG